MNKSENETAARASVASVSPPSEPAPGFIALTLGSVGVVFGDIGTSPLYAFREAVLAAGGQDGASRDIVLGVLSLILWALIVTRRFGAVKGLSGNNGSVSALPATMKM